MAESTADNRPVWSATYEVGAVDDALPWLIDAMHHVGLRAEAATDLVLEVYEEMRRAAENPETRRVGVEVEARQDTVTVAVHEDTAELAPGAQVVELEPRHGSPNLPDAAKAVADELWRRRRRQGRHSDNWVVITNTIDEPVVGFTLLDRAAVLAGLTTATASTAAFTAAAEQRDLQSSSFTVPVGPAAPSFVRRSVGQLLQENAVSDETQGDVELLVSELVSNVIRHEDVGMINVGVTVDAARAVTVTVTGSGEANRAPSAALVHPTGPPDSASSTGRGLGVLDSLASAWGTSRQHRTTTVWFNIRGPGALELAQPVERAMAELEPPRLRDPVAAHDEYGAIMRAASASAAVASAVSHEAATIATVAQELTVEPQVVAVQAANTAEQAAIAAATRTADAARQARAARATAATAAAAEVADAAARTVAAVQIQADELAAQVATTAAVAAATLSKSVLPGGDAEAAREAVRVGTAVISAAANKAKETTRAAVLVARAVAAAAAAVAATTAAEAAAVENEVLDAAVAVRAVTAATAHQLATETVDRAAVVAAATRAAAEASERLREANLELQRSGRHDRSVALALQAAMLTELPEPESLQLAARYLTAAEQDRVGGDWYDALVLPNRSTTLVIGDVVGHDIVAAAVMGQLRNVLRALVWDREEVPSAVVGRLDRAVRDLHINTLATIIVASVDPPQQPGGASLLRWANAGHPAPILVEPDGGVSALTATTDVLLGVVPNTVRRDHTYLVPPGATLLLYTDGLIEHRERDIDVGQRLLLDAVHAHHRLELGALIDAVIADMVGGRPDDDVAVLAARFH